MSANTELIDAEIEAYRDRNLERYLGFFAEDIVVTDFDGNFLMQGLEGLSDNYGPLFANSPNLAVEVVSRIETGRFVVDLEHLDGFVNPPYPQSFDAGCIYLVNDGKIAAMKLLL
ncbi:MAG: nuclear transport factor 2 family protein [Acidimicrobiales bacterium]